MAEPAAEILLGIVGGTLAIDSAAGAGTTVELRVPQ